MKFEKLSTQGSHAHRRFTQETEHPMRDGFNRDRDRILYSKAFRRLNGKTQVFVTSFDDHMRNRLTHTLEVAQIAKTISNILGLNEVLTEAIALGHDIGHTPFGHVGERTLNFIMNGCDPIKDYNIVVDDKQRGFKHNWQGVRIVTDLENKSSKFSGLNLTDYVVWGIVNHSRLQYRKCDFKYGVKGDSCGIGLDSKKKCRQQEFGLGFYKKYEDILASNSWSFEALVVGFADEIAQRHHDIEDGIEAKIIKKDELIDFFSENFSEDISKHCKDFEQLSKEDKKEYYLPLFSRFIVNFLVTELITNMSEKLEELILKYSINKPEEFYEMKKTDNGDFLRDARLCVNFSNSMISSHETLETHLKNIILNSYYAQRLDGRSKFIIRQLFKAYITNPQQLADTTILKLCLNYLGKKEFDTLSVKYSGSDYVGQLRGIIASSHRELDNKKFKWSLLRTVTDYISGMTDNYAVSQYQDLFGHNQGFSG